MAIGRKITRILLKTFKYLFVLVVLLCVFAVIAINSESFQTWLAHKAAAYLSKDLGTRVEIEKVSLRFIKSADLEGVFIEGKDHDTLLYSKAISVKLENFDYNKQTLKISEVKLTGTKAFLVKHKDQEDFNFQHLVNYFSSGDTVKSSSSWKITYGKLVLENIDFVYINENKDTSAAENINYNNINLKGVYGEVDKVSIADKNIYASVTGLKCKEQCGLTLTNFNGDLKVSPTKLECLNLDMKTANSSVKGGFSFSYKGWDSYNDFINKVMIRALLIDTTKINFKDIAYFVKELNGIDNSVYLTGNVKGYVNDLKGERIKLLFGEHTKFYGDLALKGLPDIRSTYLHFDVHNLSTSRTDLEKIPSYPFSEKKHLQLPADLSKLGIVNYKGKFDGYTNDFASKGSFNTALGSLYTDVKMKIDTATDVISYNGKLATDHFNLGKLAGLPNLGALSINSTIKGKGITLKEVDAELNGVIRSISFKNYAYQNITLNGNVKNKIFKGKFVVKDNNADLDFDGKIDMSQKIPEMDFISTINKLNLKRLGLLETKTDGTISAQLLINLTGNNIDDVSGLINIDNIIYKTEEKDYKISTFNLELEQSTVQKDIKLTSNIFNFSMNGPFKISNLGPSFNHFLYTYYPAFFPDSKSKTVYTDNFKYKLTIKKFNTVRELFVKDLAVSPGSIFEGDFDATKNILNLNMQSDSIRYKTLKFNINKIESYSQNNKINLVFKSNYIDLTDSIRLYNYFMYFVSKDKNTKYNAEWNNKTTPQNAGKIAGKALFENSSAILTFDNIFLTAHDSTWKMVSADTTTIDSSGVVRVKPLIFANNNQGLSIHGGLSNKPGEKLAFDIKNFELGQLSPFFGSSLKIEGTLNGQFALHNTMKNLAFSSDLSFEKLKLNNKSLGHGELKAEYNNHDKYLYLDGFTSIGLPDITGERIKNIAFSGYYYLNKKEESLDINLSAQPANLTLLNPYLTGILTLNTGLVTGEGKITGTPEKPMINGKFKIVKCDLKVDYLNVTYGLAGTIEVYPDQISFQDMKLTDDVNKKNWPGTLSGNIFHNNFKNMQIDYDINFNNMLVLNKTNDGKEPFYGKAYATGRFGIYGFLNNIAMEIKAKTEKGTVFTIPLDGPAEVSENSFIRFVKRDTTKKINEVHKSGFKLDMTVEATPEAEVQIVLDAKSGDVIKARGRGNIDLRISNLGKFDMFGEYVLNSGEYLFTLANAITKKFEIEKGSTINWSGSPYAAEIDITANYKQRASIAPLFPYDTTGTYKRRLPVDCKLLMHDKLMSPNISFAIDMPTLDENTSSKIQSILNDETELNRQVFSLLLLKTFLTPLQYSQGGGISAGSAVAANSTEMLSNRVSGWLSGLTKEVDIGVNYRPGNEMSSDELDIALSKQLLNNRLSIDGNFGFNNNQTTSTTGLIGDVNLEYKLTEDGRYRVRGFNRTNDNTQLTTQGGPYTQGVGVFYREEYETWAELYRRYIKKIKKEPKPEIKPETDPAATP